MIPRSMTRGGVLAALLVLGGCSGMQDSSDFDRQRYSRLLVPYDRKDVVYFDATFTPAYPDEDPVAEAMRERWLADYLELRGLCPNGYDVAARRPFEFLEDNPARHDVRYEVRCRPAEP